MKRLILILSLLLPLGLYAAESNSTINSNGISNGIQLNLPCNPSSITNGKVDPLNCSITCDNSYVVSGNSCIISSPGSGNPGNSLNSGGGSGGGGGGGGGGFFNNSNSLSNSTIINSPISSELEKIGPVTFLTNTIGNNKVAQLTTDTGTLILKSSPNSLIKLVISSGTTVTSDINWDGIIIPPIEKKNDNIKKMGAVLIVSGNEKSILTFNKEVNIKIQSTLKEGTEVSIYYSNFSDLSNLQVQGNYKVQNGFINIPTNHLSHFIIKTKIQKTSDSAQYFSDIESSFAREDIINLTLKGVIQGYDDGTFKPDNTATRAEFLAMTFKSLEIQVDDSINLTKFSDIPNDGAWMIKYVEKAKEMGIVSGQIIKGKLSFRPNDSISRAEAIAILLNAADIFVDKTVKATAFKDINANWMIPYISKAQELGIISGQLIDSKLKFRPNDPISRAEASRVINKVMIDYPPIPSVSS